MNPAIIDNMSWAMAEVYAAVTDRIMINLAHHFPYVQHDMHMGSFEYQSIMLAQMGKVERETIEIIAGSLGNADEALKQALETAILEGLKNEEPKLRKAAMKGLLNGGVPQLAPSQMQAFTYFYNQSADKLNLVNTVMLESTKAAYQSTVADISQKIATTQSILNASAGEVITGVSTWNKAMHDGVQKMVKNGLTGFIDHGGHKWSPEAYVAMDIKTTMFNTARQATWERQEQYGSDLYQVSSHNGARPLCYPWQGKVISTSGRTGITQDIDGNEVIIHSQDEIESFRYGGGLFGVNCGHYPMTFIPNFSSLKGEPQDPDENAKTYAESQQQRALERNLREQKRDLEVMKAQGASPEDIAKQREKVRSASADIDQFCDETGRARKRSREYTPVNAEFPDVPPTPQTPVANVAPQATTPPPEPHTIVGKTEKLKASMTQTDYEEYAKLVDNSPSVGLYEKYGDSCKSIKYVKDGGVYKTGFDSVEYDYSSYKGQSKYSIVAHEMGHMFDAKIGRVDWLTYKEADLINSKCTLGSGAWKVMKVVPSTSDKFLAAMRSDATALKTLLGQSGEIAKMKAGTMVNASAGVQDLLDGFYATQDRNVFGWGHGNRYYNRAYNQKFVGLGLEDGLREAMKELGYDVSNKAKVKTLTRQYEAASELWANGVSAITCGGEELEAMKKYTPNTIQAILDIIGGI